MKIERKIENASYKIELSQKEFDRLKDTLMKGKNWMEDLMFKGR
jgi:hypothetical protein